VIPAAEAAARFAREWNFALGLVLAAAAPLWTGGHPAFGMMAVGLAAAAFLVRRSAMRRQGRGFYGQEKHR
jgi:hypothetical protein